MSISSLQPTIRIRQNGSGHIEHAVYMGCLSGSRADQDLLWAYVRDSSGGIRVLVKDTEGIPRPAGYVFNGHYSLTPWLDRLVAKVSDECGIPWRLSIVIIAAVDGIVRLVLEDCIGDDPLLVHGNKDGLFERSLRQANRGGEDMLPYHIQSLIDDMVDFRPCYYHPSYPVRVSPAVATEVIKREGDNADAVQARSGVAARRSYPLRRRRARKNTQAAAVEVEDHTVTIPPPNSVSAAVEPEDNKPEVTNLVHPEATDVVHSEATSRGTDDTNARAETERIIISPAKEKAIGMIERHLQDWRDGKIDEEALENTIQASLSDVRLARQMQSTVIAASKE